MKKQTRLIALALLVLAVALILFWPAPPEPTHAGRPLRDWLVDFDQAQSTTNHIAACAAIRAMGTNALPALIRYLRMKDPDVSVRGNAASALGQTCSQLGSPAKSAVPELIKLLNDTNAYPGRMGTLGKRAMDVLTQIDPDAAARAEAESPSYSPSAGRRIN